MTIRQQRFARFCLVGALGFVVDGAVLELFRLGLEWGNLAARVPSFSCAVLATWLLNRKIAFAAPLTATIPWPRELLRYLSVSLGGNLVNLLVYTVLAITLFAPQPLIALALASGAALLFNYVGYSRWVFVGGKRRPSAPDKSGTRSYKRVP